MTTSEPTSSAEPVHERPLLDEKALRAETDWGVGLARVSGLETTEKNKPFYYDPRAAAWALMGCIAALLIMNGVAGALVSELVMFVFIAVVIISAISFEIAMSEKRPLANFRDLVTHKTVRPEVEDRHRVWCVGLDGPISRVLKQGPIRDESFEPIVLPIWRPMLSTLNVLFGLAVGATVLAVLVFLSRQFGLLRSAVGMFGLAAFIVGGLAMSFVKRRYFRITPGTLELMEYGFLGRGTPRVTRYDLRAPRVIVDLNANMVYITEPSGTLHDVRIEDWRTRFTFARAVLAAAVSTAQVPELPRDRFTD